jgi:dihydrofolate synthase/folylpolyglutamate synthase
MTLQNQDIKDALARFEQLHPKSIDLSLDRLRRLLDQLGNPQEHLPPTVHIAGTNGKGSVIAHLRAMAEADGKIVHVYTSPHLVRFHERVRIGGSLIDDETLMGLLREIEDVNNGSTLTLFEATTALAFLAFARSPADLCLLETGLGGRLDATNCIKSPKLCLITALGLDHQDYLGSSLPEIAAEKAGIFKNGAELLSLDQPDEALRILEQKALSLGARLICEGRDFHTSKDNDRLVFETADRLLDLPLSRLTGPHQVHNAGLAIMAALKLGIKTDAIETGLRNVNWPARMQAITKGSLVTRLNAHSELWLDGAHNPHAALALKETLINLHNQNPAELVIIFGQLKTKDAREFMEILNPLGPQWRFTGFDHPLSLRPVELQQQALSLGIRAHIYNDLVSAISVKSSSSQRVLIAGSLYLAGEALSQSPETWPQ